MEELQKIIKEIFDDREFYEEMGYDLSDNAVILDIIDTYHSFEDTSLDPTEDELARIIEVGGYNTEQPTESVP